MIIVLQYWEGDEEKTLRLARILADIEPKKRTDALLVLSRRKDCKFSEEARKTSFYCQNKFDTIVMNSDRDEVGHPDGCFGLWSGTVEKLYRLWQNVAFKHEHAECVATLESDGAPIRKDWVSRMMHAHKRTLACGLRVTGAVMDLPQPHVNGNLMLSLSVWGDYPSLNDCPSGVAWDLCHAGVLLREARGCQVIRNEYGTTNWTAGSLNPIGRESAWLHGVKDDSVFEYIRLMQRTLWRDM